jgi:hypothetical protein
MSVVKETETEFERNARAVLAQSVARIDGRTRSRLNQARQAALEAAARRRPFWWRPFTLMPAAGAAAAAVLVAMVLWHRGPTGVEAPMAVQGAAVEDMDLLADSEGLDLMEGWDGPFYEWAVAQTDGNGESAS